MRNSKVKITSYSTFVQYLTKSLHRQPFKIALPKRRCDSKSHIVEFGLPGYNLLLIVRSEKYLLCKKMESSILKKNIDKILQRLECFIDEYELKEHPTREAIVLNYDVDNSNFKYSEIDKDDIGFDIDN